MTLLARLREAEPTDVPGDEPSPAQVRAAAQVAKAELAAVLRERVALLKDADREIGKLVDDALARVLALIAGQPTDYQLWVLPRLVDGLKRIAEELAAAASAQTTGTLAKAWDMGTRAVDAPLEADAKAVAKAVTTPAGQVSTQPLAALGQPDLRQLRAMQQFTTHLIGGATSDAVNAINRELGQVVLGVQTPFDAMRKVQAQLPDRTKSQVRGIVNTQLAQAFNSASFARLQQQAKRDPKLKKQWRRSGKRLPRWNHELADGQVQDVDKPFVLQSGDKRGTVEMMFPCEPGAPLREVMNCGCVALAWKASWGMLNKGSKSLTPQEVKDRGQAKPKRAVKAAAPATTQEKALSAFGADEGKPASLRDVTGQTLVIDQRVFGSGAAPAGLAKGDRDLAAYFGVQAVRRPTEVWQSERIDLASGEIVRTREFVKRFEAAGLEWVGLVTFRADGARWVGEKAFSVQPAGHLPQGLRPGVKVYPRKPRSG